MSEERSNKLKPLCKVKSASSLHLDFCVKTYHVNIMNTAPSIYNDTPVMCKISRTPIPYQDALDYMEKKVTQITQGQAKETLWLLEHPALYTAGTSARPIDLVDPERFPVFKTGRGGQYTYHGPGQRVGYIMLDLKKRRRDVRRYVHGLETLTINTLADFGVHADRRDGRVGVWVDMPGGSEAKIAAIGVRIRKWVSYHGISINVGPDLSHFEGIVPCGISEHGVTSLHALGVNISMDELDTALLHNFTKLFGPVRS